MISDKAQAARILSIWGVHARSSLGASTAAWVRPCPTSRGPEAIAWPFPRWRRSSTRPARPPIRRTRPERGPCATVCAWNWRGVESGWGVSIRPSSTPPRCVGSCMALVARCRWSAGIAGPSGLPRRCPARYRGDETAGLTQRRSGNRAKSLSKEHREVPYSMASAARCASVTRLPRRSPSTRRRARTCA